MQTLSQRNGRHVSSCASRAVPYRTRLTGRLMSMNEGSGGTRRTPRHFEATPRNDVQLSTRSVKILSSNAISASGAVTFGEWLASISKQRQPGSDLARLAN